MRMLIVAAFVAAFMALGTSAAFAGEITGNGKLKEVKGNSPCAYSGQEDLQWYTNDGDRNLRPDPTKGDPAHSQSWGQIVSGAGGHLGGANDTVGPEGPTGCNAHTYGMK
jgi:hypothetical protein